MIFYGRYPELLSTTQQLADVASPAPPQSSSSHPLQFTPQVQAVTRVRTMYLIPTKFCHSTPSPQLWFLAEVHDLCRSSCSDYWLCGRVLARLSLSELSDLLQNPDIPKVGLQVSKARVTLVLCRTYWRLVCPTDWKSPSLLPP